MSLTRRLWLLVLLITATACAGSLVTSLWSHRQYLENQLAIKNHDNAAALAISLSQQSGDMHTVRLLIAAQYDTGHYRSIRLIGPENTPLVTLSDQTPPPLTPDWFMRLLPIDSKPGIAQVSAGWTALGQVEVISHSSFAYGVLWDSALRLLALLAVVGALSGLLGTLLVRKTLKPLAALAQQARALAERRFIKAAPPQINDLAPLTHAMNSMVDRVQAQYAEHAATVEHLRHAATTDPVTGIANRPEFQRRLDEALQPTPQARIGSLLIVRIRNLQDLNQAHGHATTDQAIRMLAGDLTSHAATLAQACTGRLNGSDIGLFMPGRKLSRTTLAELRSRFNSLLKNTEPGPQLALGASAITPGMTCGQALAQADTALAAAEADANGIAWLDNPQMQETDQSGQESWRRNLQEALTRRRISIQLLPVMGLDGGLLHQQSEITLSWGEHNNYHPAKYWMPFALRTGTATAIEEIAIEQSLKLSEFASTSISLRLDESTLRDSAALAHLVGLLDRNQNAVRRLCIEIPEAMVYRDPDFGLDLARTLRRSGARIGLSEAGAYLSRIAIVPALELDHIRINANPSALAGTMTTSAAQAYLAGVIAMARGMGIKVILDHLSPTDAATLTRAAGADGWVIREAD